MRKVWFLLLLCCLCLAGCQKNETPPEPIPDPPPELSVELVESEAPQQPDLEQAVLDAVFSQNRGNYFPGECQGAGFQIFETFEEEQETRVYALIEYLEYGFQDGVFVNLSGTRARVLMVFHRERDGAYTLTEYIPLDSTSGLSEQQLEQLMEPLQASGKQYTYTEQTNQQLRQQADAWAQAYLQSIGRQAAVKPRSDHRETLLPALGVSSQVYEQLVKDPVLSSYPDWNGTQETIEEGIRYLYQTQYDSESQQIDYTKTKTETGQVVQRLIVDAATGSLTEQP